MMMMNTGRVFRPERGVYADARCGGEKCGVDKRKSLAMVYEVDQSFENLYRPEEALLRGTLFKELDMPFHKGFRI